MLSSQIKTMEVQLVLRQSVNWRVKSMEGFKKNVNNTHPPSPSQYFSYRPYILYPHTQTKQIVHMLFLCIALPSNYISTLE